MVCTSKTSFPLQQVAKFNLTGDSSLYILLPRASTVHALQEVEKRMTYSGLQKMITDMGTITPSTIEVTLPLIKLNYQPNMHLLIKKLGLLVSRHLSLSVRPSVNDASPASLFFPPSDPLGFSFCLHRHLPTYFSLPFSLDSQACHHSLRVPTCAASIPETGWSWMMSNTKPSSR